MKKKSVFNASFEESLNLEDDGWLQNYINEQNKKSKKFSEKDYFSLKAKMISLILTLIFPVFLNFMLVPIMMIVRDEPEKLTVPISTHELLTVEVYILCLVLWLSLVVIGKRIKQVYLFSYRYHFHTLTYLLWLITEFNLAAIELTLPTLTEFGVLAFFSLIAIFSYWMIKVRYRGIQLILYEEVSTIRLSDKIAKFLLTYGSGLLGILLIIRFILSNFTADFSDGVKGVGLLLAWFVLNIGLVVLLVFLEFPYYLQAYYKWKYPEEYREWEGKSMEEWYGKKYLKKHKELLKDES